MRRTSTPSQPIPEKSVVPLKQRKGAIRMPPWSMVLIAVILVVAVILGVKQKWPSESKKSQEAVQQAGQTASAPESIRELIGKVAKHILVKEGEDPTVATIQDVETLKRQNPVFYKDAQNGDRLLIWSDKAVLYSPTRDIILSVLPISLPPSALNQQPSDGSATGTASAETQAKEEKATIEVRNGSATVGVAKTMSDRLAQLGLSVLKPTDAKKKDYAQTIVVKLTDKELPLTLQAVMAATGDAQVVTLPAGENASKADFLIIVGADFKK